MTKKLSATLKKINHWIVAGSFKVESLGTSLFTSVKSEDPTALEGLPFNQTLSVAERPRVQNSLTT